jgi:hypothetical protein
MPQDSGPGLDNVPVHQQSEEAGAMAGDLPGLIRAVYGNAVMTGRDTDAAFRRATEALLNRRPALGHEEARREVAAILALEPHLPNE